jgi:hypothetical protein
MTEEYLSARLEKVDETDKNKQPCYLPPMVVRILSSTVALRLTLDF